MTGRIVIGLADDIASELAREEFDAPGLRDIATHFLREGRRFGRLLALLSEPAYAGIRVTRLVEDDAGQEYDRSRPPIRIQARLEDELRRLSDMLPVPTLLGFFVLEAPGLDEVAVKRLVARLRELMKPDPETGKPDLETAYVEQRVIPARTTPPPAGGKRTYGDFRKQAYLTDVGINLPIRRAGAQKPWWESYDGTGINFIDVELGWNVNHEAFDSDVRNFSAGDPSSLYAAHGAGVLGIVRANGTKSRIRGIAPGCTLTGLYALQDEAGPAKKQTETAIHLATSQLRAGDVILVPLQTDGDLPVEADPGVFRRIQQAVAKGIVVIEPSGDAGDVLEFYANDGDLAPGWADSKLGPAHRINGIPDSGAIIVGGCEVEKTGRTYGVPNQDADTRGGARVDCCAWSQQVWTSFSDQDAAYADFTATSASSAIIAGLSIVVQQSAHKHSGQPLTPKRLRELLRDPAYGKAVAADSTDPSRARRPAVTMPDACKLFAKIESGI